MTEPNRYLVTGGAGFVGSNLVATIAARDPDGVVLIVDDMRSGSFANIVEVFRGRDLPPFQGHLVPDSIESIDHDDILDSFEPDVVFHMAAITDTTVVDEAEMLLVNTEASRSLLIGCVEREVPLVYASSAATYGTPPHVEQRAAFPLEAAGYPNNVYGFSKWMMERDAIRMAEGAPVVGLRFFNVYGPGESRKGRMSSMVYQLAKQAIAGEPLRLFHDGSQARDQVHVQDVVDCCLAASGLFDDNDPEPGIYNVGSGQATSFNEIAEAIREGLGLDDSESPVEYFPMPTSIRAFYQDFTCADLGETMAGLGWSPRILPHEGIASYAQWLRDRTPSAESMA